jgi:hypothetical protein
MSPSRSARTTASSSSRIAKIEHAAVAAFACARPARQDSNLRPADTAPGPPRTSRADARGCKRPVHDRAHFQRAHAQLRPLQQDFPKARRRLLSPARRFRFERVTRGTPPLAAATRASFRRTAPTRPVTTPSAISETRSKPCTRSPGDRQPCRKRGAAPRRDWYGGSASASATLSSRQGWSHLRSAAPRWHRRQTSDPSTPRPRPGRSGCSPSPSRRRSRHARRSLATIGTRSNVHRQTAPARGRDRTTACTRFRAYRRPCRKREGGRCRERF